MPQKPNALRIRSKAGGKRVCRRACLLHPLVVRREAPHNKRMASRAAFWWTRAACPPERRRSAAGRQRSWLTVRWTGLLGVLWRQKLVCPTRPVVIPFTAGKHPGKREIVAHTPVVVRVLTVGSRRVWLPRDRAATDEQNQRCAVRFRTRRVSSR